MTAQEDLKALNEEQGYFTATEFADIDGNPITVGSFVQYAVGGSDPLIWNEERWGIVVGMSRTEQWDYETGSVSLDKFDYSVEVHAVEIVPSRYRAVGTKIRRDWWNCRPERVRVIG